MNKVLTTIGGCLGIVGFMLLVGVAGASDYAVKVGEYLPWYYGWQYLLLGIVLMWVGGHIVNLFYDEESEYED